MSEQRYLQWSHGDVAMEIFEEFARPVLLEIPSMEPWRCSHGDVVRLVP